VSPLLVLLSPSSISARSGEGEITEWDRGDDEAREASGSGSTTTMTKAIHPMMMGRVRQE
jgi:hypothetical protein